MSTVILRSENLKPLTIEQVDNNFNNLNKQKVEVLNTTEIVYAVPDNIPGQVVRRNDEGSFTANVVHAALDGNASTSSKWITPRTIALLGDITGSVSEVDGTSDISISTNISKDYVSSITGTPNRISTTGSGIASDIVLDLPQDIHTAANPTFAGIYLNNITAGIVSDNTISTLDNDLILDSATGSVNVSNNLIVTGDLSVYGTTSTVVQSTYNSPIFSIGTPFEQLKDRGILFYWTDGTSDKTGFFGYDSSSNQFTFIPDAINTNDVISGTKGTVDANVSWSNILNKPSPIITFNLTGDVTGTASGTLTNLENASIDVITTISLDSIVLGTDTSGDYVADITAGTPGEQSLTSGLTIIGSGESASIQIAHADTSDVVSVNNSGNTFIQDIVVDGFGHITSIDSGTVSINDGSLSVLTNSQHSGLTGGGQLGTVNQSSSSSLNISHSNIILAGVFGEDEPSRTIGFGESFTVPYVSYDANGHLTSSSNKTLSLTSLPVASEAISGIVSIHNQNFAGDKTFTGSVTVNNDITASNFNSFSDIKLKTNILPINSGLDTLCQLYPVEFNWVETGQKSSGVVAQDLENVIPHLVNTSTDGTKSVNYIGIIAYLIKAVQELDQKIKQLSGEG